jgi:cell fate (sporulation/competence/biofilm development) regulator YmcA (YheA/YmcA/DUF963 family)
MIHKEEEILNETWKSREREKRLIERYEKANALKQGPVKIDKKKRELDPSTSFG